MFKWLGKKAINAYLKDLLKQIASYDIKTNVLVYLENHEDEIIEKIKTVLQKVVDKAIEKFADKD